MERFFGMDSGLFRFMGKAADLLILNLLTLICCIPVCTVGAAVTALYTTTIKIVRNEDSYIVRGYFKAFRENFRQATIIWLIFLAVGILLGVDFYICNRLGDSFLKTLRYVFVALFFVYAMMVAYVFPLQARFVNTIRHTIKNSFLFSISNLPFTILILAIYAAPIIILMFLPQVTPYVLLYLFLYGISLPAYISSQIFNRIFHRFMTEESGDVSNTDADTPQS